MVVSRKCQGEEELPQKRGESREGEESTTQKQEDITRYVFVLQVKAEGGILWELGVLQLRKNLKRKGSKLLKAYLDTNVLIEYLWFSFFAKDGKKTPLSISVMNGEYVFKASGKFFYSTM